MTHPFIVQVDGHDGAEAHFIIDAADALDTFLDLTKSNPDVRPYVNKYRTRYIDNITGGTYTETDPLAAETATGEMVKIFRQTLDMEL